MAFMAARVLGRENEAVHSNENFRKDRTINPPSYVNIKYFL